MGVIPTIVDPYQGVLARCPYRILYFHDCSQCLQFALLESPQYLDYNWPQEVTSGSLPHPFNPQLILAVEGQCTVCILHFTLYTLHFTVYTLTVCCTQFTISVQSELHSALNNTQCESGEQDRLNLLSGEGQQEETGDHSMQ